MPAQDDPSKGQAGPQGCCPPSKEMMEKMMSDPRMRECMKAFAESFCGTFAKGCCVDAGEEEDKEGADPGGCSGG